MSTADDIAPDDKDWTWVLERPCPECGFDASTLDGAEVGRLARSNAAAWVRLLEGLPEVVRNRTRPDRWSALEYACHVRDVYALAATRLERMLGEDDPLFANWDQDETARQERYGEQLPAHVGVEVVEAASRLADAYDAVSSDQWHRRGRRSDGAVFTVDSFGRYLIHDPIHHVFDVTGVRAAD